RAAGVYMIVSAQDPLGLGDERARSAMLTNSTIVSFRQATQVEAISQIVGTERQDEAGADYTPAGQTFDRGVVRRQHTFKVHPQMLRELQLGQFAIVSAGKAAKGVGAVMVPGVGSGTYVGAAVREELEALEVPAVEPPSVDDLIDGTDPWGKEASS
ncbi:MAG TPA: hypothetical protein VF714_04305, partial [Jatrophihabitans sp.]